MDERLNASSMPVSMDFIDLFVDSWFHVVGGHRDGEAPVDESESGKERNHHHILNPAGFKEEETDDQQQDAVDEIHPPVGT